jgi:hypothetical protein
MKIHILAGAATLHALLDSSSTHNFIAEDSACDRSPPAARQAHHHGRQRRARALPLAGYGVVLDTQWLATLGPILWDFGRLTLSFWHLHLAWHRQPC